MILVEAQNTKDALEFFESWSDLFTRATEAVIAGMDTDKDVREALAVNYLMSQSDDEISGWAMRALEEEEKAKAKAEPETPAETPARENEVQKEMEEANKVNCGTEQERSQVRSVEVIRNLDLSNVLFEFIRWHNYAALYLRGERKGNLEIHLIDHMATVHMLPLTLAAFLTEALDSNLTHTGYYSWGKRRGEHKPLIKTFEMWNKGGNPAQLEVCIRERANQDAKASYHIDIVNGHAVVPAWQLGAMINFHVGGKLQTSHSKHGTNYIVIDSEPEKKEEKMAS